MRKHLAFSHDREYGFRYYKIEDVFGPRVILSLQTLDFELLQVCHSSLLNAIEEAETYGIPVGFNLPALHHVQTSKKGEKIDWTTVVIVSTNTKTAYQVEVDVVERVSVAEPHGTWVYDMVESRLYLEEAENFPGNGMYIEDLWEATSFLDIYYGLEPGWKWVYESLDTEDETW